MKRIIIYIVLFAAALTVPTNGMDIGELKPVAVIALDVVDNQVRISTDTGDAGYGESFGSALEDLEQTTAGVVFLDTADYLLIGEGAEDLAEDAKEYLKRRVRVCGYTEGVPLRDAAEYLDVHRPETELEMWESGQSLECLSMENERMKLVKK